MRGRFTQIAAQHNEGWIYRWLVPVWIIFVGRGSPQVGSTPESHLNYQAESGWLSHFARDVVHEIGIFVGSVTQNMTRSTPRKPLSKARMGRTQPANARPG